MNLGQIKQRVRMLGRNYFGTDADRDPFGLDYIVKEAANQIARNTDCLVGRRFLNLVADQYIYASPDIYKIRATRFLDTNGDYTQPRMYNSGGTQTTSDPFGMIMGIGSMAANVGASALA